MADMTDTADTEKNKRIVEQGVEELYGKGNVDGIVPLLHDDFVDHNPQAPSSKADAIEFLRGSPLTRATCEVQRLVAEGDYVVLHSHVRLPGDERGSAVVDIWRFEDGLIVEHWDVVQPIPAESPNPVAMF